MTVSAQKYSRRDLEIGFYNGVARALDGGFKYMGILEDREELLNRIEHAMDEISKKEKKKNEPQPNWSSRGAKLAAETITMFEIAWRNDKESTTMVLTAREIEDFLSEFRARSNCGSHM